MELGVWGGLGSTERQVSQGNINDNTTFSMIDMFNNLVSAFFSYHHDMISIVPWLIGPPAYVTCSLDVAKQLMANETQERTELSKPYWDSLPFRLVTYRMGR